LILAKENINFEKVYFYSITIFAFFLPLSRAVISFFIVMLPLLWLYEGNLKEKISYIKNNKTLFSFYIYIIFLFLSLLWTQNYHDAIRPLRMLLYTASIAVIATSLKKQYIPTVISAFLLGLFISEIATYGIFFDLWHSKKATHAFPNPFMTHLNYSIFLAFGALLLLYRIFSKKYSKKEKILYLLFFLTITGNLFITGGRTGQLAFLVGLFVMSFLHFKVSLKSLAMFLALSAIIYSSGYMLSENFKTRMHEAKSDIERIFVQKDFNSSWGIRVAYWIASANIIQKDPLLGVGIGDFHDAMEQEIKQGNYDNLIDFVKDFMSKHTPHNQYLLITIQSGFIGLFFFLYFLYNFFTMKLNDKELKTISILFGTIFVVSFFSDTFLYQQFTLSLFILFLALFTNKDLQKEH
jgi:O-antigen ligase